MFDHLLESSHLDDSNKWSTIGSFGEEICNREIKICTLSGTLELTKELICFDMAYSHAKAINNVCLSRINVVVGNSDWIHSAAGVSHR